MGRPLGRRRRRLFWAIGLLSAAALVGSASGYAIWRASRPEVYRPGEEIAEITSRLDLGVPEEAPEPRFTDVTVAAGLDGFDSFVGTRTSQLPEDMGSGAAWDDFDGDGDDDLFLVSQGGPIGGDPGERARSRLYENLGDGSFVEVGEFPETRILGMGAAWGDYDGDGDPDLVVTGYNALRLFRNDDARFVRDPAIEERRGFWAGTSWSDFDQDGDLDLYVCGYVQYVEDPEELKRTTQQYGRAVPYTLNPASYEPARNLLLRNDGDDGFTEVAGALGVDNPAGRSLGALWHDLDDDGRPDLYVANDISDNALFLNRGDHFEDSSHAAWVADYRGAMGLAVGDWNRDGDDDLFVTHWIAQENALYDSLLVDFQRRGETTELRFMDVADQRGLGQIALQLVGWGTEFLDLDSDGWLDLVVANGSTFETAGEPRELRPQPPFLFWSRGGQSFHDLAPLVPALAEPRVSRGLALSDFDMDGDLDLLFVDRDGGVRLLRNDTKQGGRIALRLRRSGGAPIEGTRVTAQLPDGVVSRSVNSVSYLSQSSRTLHLGLGQATRVERLKVRWPGGGTESFDGLDAGALYELSEGSGARRLATFRVELTRDQLAEFWRYHRAAMNAVKVDGDCERAIELFGQALDLDPAHEDALYYLGNCLAERGDVEGALKRFAELGRINTQSQRAFKRWGTLRAVIARDVTGLDDAIEALERAAEINPEETGVGLVLGEVELMRGNRQAARRRLESVVQTNPQSGEAFFVLAYLDWIDGDEAGAVLRLQQSAGTRSEDWKPEGVIAEGEVRKKMHTESTPFADVYSAWDSQPLVEPALRPLAARLEGHVGSI